MANLTGTTCRTVRRWTSFGDDDTHKDIPYAAWRLLLIAAGLVGPTNARDPF